MQRIPTLAVLAALLALPTLPDPLPAQIDVRRPEVSALADAVTAFGIEESAIFGNPANVAHLEPTYGMFSTGYPAQVHTKLELPMVVLNAQRGSDALFYSVRVPYFVAQSRPFSGAFGIFANGILESDTAVGARSAHEEAVLAGSVAFTARPGILYPFVREVTAGVSYAHRRLFKGELPDSVDNSAVGAGVILNGVLLPHLFVGAAVSDAERLLDGGKPSEWRVGAAWRPLFGFDKYDISISADYVHPSDSPPDTFLEGVRIGLANESNAFLEHIDGSVEVRGGFRFVDTDTTMDDEPLVVAVSIGLEASVRWFRVGFSYQEHPTPAVATALANEHQLMVYFGLAADGDP
jgi:hypothetical protein